MWCANRDGCNNSNTNYPSLKQHRRVVCNQDGCNGFAMKAKEQDGHDREFHVRPDGEGQRADGVGRGRGGGAEEGEEAVARFDLHDAARARRHWVQVVVEYRFNRMRLKRFKIGEKTGVNKHFTQRAIWSRLLKADSLERKARADRGD